MSFPSPVRHVIRRRSRAVVAVTTMMVTTLAGRIGAQSASEALPPLRAKHVLFELYAADALIARVGEENMKFAVEQFRRHFGHDPHPIAIVYFDGESATLKTAEFQRRGLLALAIPSGSAQRESGGASTAAVPSQLGESFLETHEACHAYLIAYVDATQGATSQSKPNGYGHPDIPDWFDEGIATLCEGERSTTERHAELRRQLDRHIPFAEFFAMRHPRLDGFAGSVGAGAPAERPAKRATFFGRDGKPMQVDSATYALVERTMAGDSTTGLSVRPSGDAPRAVAPHTMTERMAAVGDPVRRARILLFYAQSQAVVRFLAVTYGERVIGRVADALARGESMERILSQESRGPSTIADLERAWVDWVKRTR